MTGQVTITAYDWVPSFARGQVRDLRVRWMLEELGEAYDVRYLSQGEQKRAPHRALQPYGQVPTLEDRGVTLFESGAIVLHLAETRQRLLPSDPQARARAIEWLFAALNTVEPPLSDLAIVNIFEFDQPWSEQRRPSVEERIRERLGETAAKLEGRDWFDGEFSIGDLMMVSVLRIIGDDPLLAEYPILAAYIARGEARPAFQRALAAQMEGFTGSAPAGFQEWVDKWEAAQKGKQPASREEQPA